MLPLSHSVNPLLEFSKTSLEILALFHVLITFFLIFICLGYIKSDLIFYFTHVVLYPICF